MIWECDHVATSEERRQESMNRMGAYVFDLLDQGKLKAGAPLFPAPQAVTVRAKDGKATAVDGPYIETKDLIGGSFVVEAESMEEATDMALNCPAATYGGVEIRGIRPRS